MKIISSKIKAAESQLKIYFKPFRNF